MFDGKKFERKKMNKKRSKTEQQQQQQQYRTQSIINAGYSTNERSLHKANEII